MHPESHPAGNSGPAELSLDDLMREVYKDLTGVADRLMRSERRDHTLATTGLVHEAYLRLSRQEKPTWEHRAQFVACAAQAMRSILVDYAKGRGRKKRLGGRKRLPLDEGDLKLTESDEDLLEIDEALTKMAAVKPDLAKLVEVRFFAGLTIERTAQVLGTSTASVERSWRSAREWLMRELWEKEPEKA